MLLGSELFEYCVELAETHVRSAGVVSIALLTVATLAAILLSVWR